MSGLKDKRDNDLLTGNIADFENKNLNLWLKQSTASFLNLKDVENAIDNDFKIDGRQVYIGFDYSMFSDNTSIGFVYPYRDEKTDSPLLATMCLLNTLQRNTQRATITLSRQSSSTAAPSLESSARRLPYATTGATC